MEFWMDTEENRARYEALTDPDEKQRLKRELVNAHYARQREIYLQHPRWQSSNWLDSYARLLELLPAARETITRPSYMGPDGIWIAAEKSGTPLESRPVLNWSRTHKEGIGTKDWDDYDDDDVYSSLITV